jgi:Tfp pilus assembly protein PilF
LGDEPGAAADAACYVELVSPDGANTEAWRLVAGPAGQRDPQWACALAHRVVAVAPRQPHFRNTLGVALYRLGRDRDAQAQFRESLRLGAGIQDAYDRYFLALCQHRRGETGQAWAEFLRALLWHGRNWSRLTPVERGELADFLAEALSGLIRPVPGL